MILKFKIVDKKERIKKALKPKEIIIKKEVLGVIFIRLNASFYIKIGDKEFNLSKESYNCSNKNILFNKYIYEEKIIKNIYTKKNELTKVVGYMPFSVGSVCKGNLIKENGNIVFDIKKLIDINKLTTPELIIDRLNSIKFYKDNYNKIISNYDL